MLFHGAVIGNHAPVCCCFLLDFVYIAACKCSKPYLAVVGTDKVFRLQSVDERPVMKVGINPTLRKAEKYFSGNPKPPVKTVFCLCQNHTKYRVKVNSL